MEQMTETVFVGRQRELDALQNKLNGLERNSFQLSLISGEAGSGKTTLVDHFEKMVHENHKKMIVGRGRCNALTGFSNPYLPFRELLNDVFMDLDNKKKCLEQDEGSGLKDFLIFSAKCVVDFAPDLIGTFVPGGSLLSRLSSSFIKESNLVRKIEGLVEKDKTNINLEENKIHEQYTNALKALAEQYRMVLILDDLQWADEASVSLLFYLARNLSGSGIFLIGMYRNSEIQNSHHPIGPVINELIRLYGSVILDLETVSQDDKKDLVNQILDSEANYFDAEFRSLIFETTNGNVLFVKELLQHLQEKGYVIRDNNGLLKAVEDINWSVVPGKLEGVIKERIERLDDNLKDILDIASVQGDSFIAQTVAKMLKMNEIDLIRKLSKFLDKKYNFIKERQVQRLGHQMLSYYYFNNFIVQQYLFNELSKSERMIFSDNIADIIEDFYQGQEDEKAVELSHLYETAENWEKALQYSMKAAQKAYKISAYKQASCYYQQALTYIHQLPENEENKNQKLECLIQLSLSLKPIKGWSDPEVISCCRQAIDLGLSIDQPQKISSMIFGLWVTYLIKLELQQAEQCAIEYLELAKHFEDKDMLVQAYVALANTKFWMGDIGNTLEISEDFNSVYEANKSVYYVEKYGQDPQSLMLFFSCLSLFLHGEDAAAEKILELLIQKAEDLNHPFSLAIALQTGVFLSYLQENQVSLNDYVQRLQEVCEVNNFVVYLGLAEMFQAFLRSASGGNSNMQQSIQQLDDGYYHKVLSDGGLVLNSLHALLVAEIALHHDQWDLAVEMIDQHAQTSLQYQEMCFYPEMLRLKGVALAQNGQNSEARVVWKEAEQRARDMQAHAFVDKIKGTSKN